MDSRHEPIEQEILNELINLINNYINDNLDDVIEKDHLRDDIRHIAQYIYEYAHMPIDVDGIVSKRNLLSNDMVLLPHVDEIVNKESLDEGKKMFTKTLEDIKLILRRHGNGAVNNRDLHQNIGMILSGFKG